jgi:hypothetical protein
MSKYYTLVFPVSTPDGKTYIKTCLQNNIPIIGASADQADPTDGLIPWFKLPLINSPEFLGAFIEIIERFNVNKIFAAAHMVHRGLKDILESQPNLNIEVINSSPIDLYFSHWDNIFERAKTWKQIIANLQPQHEDIKEEFIAGIIHHAFNIFGESYDDKLAALLSCLTNAPEGDIVEIGTLFGRSLCVLLSGRSLRNKNRNVFVFDPWCSELGLQKDLPDNFQKYTQAVGIDKIPRIFESIVSVFSTPGSLSAHRCSSAEGFIIYKNALENKSKRLLNEREFIVPKGKVALLHIDGNHDLESVSQDVDLWTQLVIPNGWVVIDDYEWRYGDGPKITGDNLIKKWENQINKTFVIGGCLFIQKK